MRLYTVELTYLHLLVRRPVLVLWHESRVWTDNQPT